MNLKALLLTSACRSKNKFWTCSITSPVGSLMPPCDLASIAAVLRRDGIEPRILDMRLYGNPYSVLERQIDNWRPDAIITNMATATAMDDYKMLNFARDKVKARIVFGFHAMAMPAEQFQQGATHILAGDPEYGASQAVNGAAAQKGIWTAGNTDSEPGFIDSLDDIPYQALDLINIKAYHSLIMGRGAFAVLLANRGCFYQCGYCVIPFLFGAKVRAPSVKHVIGEIERDVSEFGIRSFFFIDSAINLNPQWTTELCEGILEKNLKVRWCSNMRVPPVSKDLLALMKRSGCFRLFYGVEDMDLLSDLNRRTTREATKEAFRLTNEAGIDTVAFMILFPGVDRSQRDMVRRVVNMAEELKAKALQCNLAIPYPGTRLYDEYAGKYDMPRDWSLYDPAGARTPYKTELDLVKVREAVYLQFYMRHPLYLWNTFKGTDIRSVYTFVKNAATVLWGRKAS